MNRAQQFLEAYAPYMGPTYPPQGHYVEYPHPYAQQYHAPQYHHAPQQHYHQELSYEELEELLRRQNPDLLEKIRFHVTDGEWNKLTGMLAKGAFHAAAVIAAPAILGPVVALKAYLKHRALKQHRKELGIYKKRLRFKYTDDEVQRLMRGEFFI